MYSSVVVPKLTNMYVLLHFENFGGKGIAYFEVCYLSITLQFVASTLITGWGVRIYKAFIYVGG